MAHLLQDLHVAWNQAVKRPGLTFIALLTLAIGVGPNTAVFSLIHAMVLRPLPFSQPRELVVVRKTVFPKGWLLALREQEKSFESLAGYTRNEEVNLIEQGQANRFTASYVSANFFDTLGTHPLMGRVFTPGEDVVGQDREVILSYSLWQQNFGSDGKVLGQSVDIEGIPRRIIGVMPPQFNFPAEQTQLWIPNPIKTGDQVDLWATQNLVIFGRLKNGVSASQALSELKLVQPQLNHLFPWVMPTDFGANIEVASLDEVVEGNIRPRLLILFGTVMLVLLISSGNIVSLFLGRAAARRKEVAIRRAMGAGRKRLFQQFIAEGVLLALCGGGLGIGIGWYGIKILKHILPSDAPRLAEARLDPQVLLFTLVLSLIVGLIIGIVPAFAFIGQDIQKSLKSQEGGVSALPVNTKFLSWLGIAQVALAVVIVSGAGLMARSFWKLMRADTGFRTEKVILAKIALDKAACKDEGKCDAFVHSLLDDMNEHSWIEGAAIVNQPVLHGTNIWFGFDAEGHQRGPHDAFPQGVEHIVSKDYFRVMGIPLIAGRDFISADHVGENGPLIINAAIARRFWPSEDPVGKHLTTIIGRQSRQIVGVVGSTRHTALESEGGYEVYVPYGSADASPVVTVVVRTSTDQDTIGKQIRSAVEGLDHSASVSNIETIEHVIDASTSSAHALLILLVLFSSISLILGIMGIYSINYYLVSWRAREIGIRMALGASPAEVKWIVLFRGVMIVAAGVFCGMVLALGTAQLFRSYLFEISPIDPLTFFAIPILFFMIAVVANWIPAHRAAATDPVKSLRCE